MAMTGIEYIHSHHWTDHAPGLSRIRELLRGLGDPQRGMRFVHIAGTNGKGSVSAMTEAILRACGYRTGLFVSPYLRFFEERIQYNGVPIPHGTLEALVERVRPVADAMQEAPTEFELVCAIGLLYFKEQQCDTVVLEVGLGGRLDPTNVIEDPLVSVITGIAMDHTAILGDTVEKIAAEKAGIVKPAAPVIWGGEDAAARSVIERAAREAGAPFVAAGDTPVSESELTLSGTVISRGGWQHVRVPLLGAYQVKNLATVLEVVEQLRGRGLALPEADVRRGLSLVRWQGRFERLCERPTVIFDGAHNPEGVRAAAESIRTYFAGHRVLLLTGVMADKAHSEMAQLLSPLAERILAVTPGNPRALPAADYAAELSRCGAAATAYESVSAATREGLTLARETGLPLVVLGSLYLYTDVLSALQELSPAGC